MWTKLCRSATLYVEEIVGIELNDDLREYGTVENAPRWSRRMGKMLLDRGYELPDRYDKVEHMVSEMSNMAQRFASTLDFDFRYEFKPQMDWEPGVFCDEGSCFWQSQYQSRYGINASPLVTTLRFYDHDAPVARTLIGLAKADPEDPRLYRRGFFVTNTYSWNGYLTNERIGNWFVNMLEANDEEFVDALKAAFPDRTLNVLPDMEYVLLTKEYFNSRVDFYVNPSPVFIARLRPITEDNQTESPDLSLSVRLNVNPDSYMACRYCDEVFHRDSMVEIGTHYACSSCMEHVLQCSRCNSAELSQHMVDVNGETYCRSCFRSVFKTCDECSRYVERSEIVSIANRDYCEHCAAQATFDCPGCGQSTRYADAEPIYFPSDSSVTHTCRSCSVQNGENIWLARKSMDDLIFTVRALRDSVCGLIARMAHAPMGSRFEEALGNDGLSRGFMLSTLSMLAQITISDGIRNSTLRMVNRSELLRRVPLMIERIVGDVAREMFPGVSGQIYSNAIGFDDNMSTLIGSYQVGGDGWLFQQAIGYASLSDIMVHWLPSLDDQIRLIERRNGERQGAYSTSGYQFTDEMLASPINTRLYGEVVAGRWDAEQFLVGLTVGNSERVTFYTRGSNNTNEDDTNRDDGFPPF